VDNIEVVAINQSIKDGRDNISCFFLGELLLGQNLIEKLASRHQLHHQVVVAIVFVNIVEFANVGMVNLLQDVDLVLQSNSVFIVHFAFGNDFDGNLVASFSLPALAHCRE